jgi:hypothetical protein
MHVTSPSRSRLASGPPSTRNAFFAACLGAAVIGAAVSASAGEQGAESGKRIAFDIAPQALPRALAAFSAATGIEVLVDARNAEGRQSAGVIGVMTPPEALRVLLTGNHLVAEEFTPGTVMLMSVAMPPIAASPSGSRPPSVDPPYFAIVQRAVLRRLCQDDATSPGGYRVGLKLWIGPYGTVMRSERLGTTGDSGRDAALDAAARSLDVGQPPPAELPQPIAVLILPHSSQDPVNCPVSARKQRRASN